MKYKNNDFDKLVDAYTQDIMQEGIFDRLGARVSGAVQGAKGFVSGGTAGASDAYQSQKFSSYLDGKLKEISTDLKAMGMEDPMIQSISQGLNAVKTQQLSQIASGGKQAQQAQELQKKAAELGAQSAEQAGQIAKGAQATQQAGQAVNARATQAAGAMQMAQTAPARYGAAQGAGGQAAPVQQAQQAYAQGARYNPMTGSSQQVQQKAQQNVYQGF